MKPLLGQVPRGQQGAAGRRSQQAGHSRCSRIAAPAVFSSQQRCFHVSGSGRLLPHDDDGTDPVGCLHHFPPLPHTLHQPSCVSSPVPSPCLTQKPDQVLALGGNLIFSWTREEADPSPSPLVPRLCCPCFCPWVPLGPRSAALPGAAGTSQQELQLPQLFQRGGGSGRGGGSPWGTDSQGSPGWFSWGRSRSRRRASPRTRPCRARPAPVPAAARPPGAPGQQHPRLAGVHAASCPRPRASRLHCPPHGCSRARRPLPGRPRGAEPGGSAEKRQAQLRQPHPAAPGPASGPAQRPRLPGSRRGQRGGLGRAPALPAGSPPPCVKPRTARGEQRGAPRGGGPFKSDKKMQHGTDQPSKDAGRAPTSWCRWWDRPPGRRCRVFAAPWGNPLPLSTSRDGYGAGGTTGLCPCTRSHRGAGCFTITLRSHRRGLCCTSRERSQDGAPHRRVLCCLRMQSIQKLVYVLACCSMGSWSGSGTSVWVSKVTESFRCQESEIPPVPLMFPHAGWSA